MFWSHIQLEGFVDKNKFGCTVNNLCACDGPARRVQRGTYGGAKAPSVYVGYMERAYWIDYFCLRQAAVDFRVPSVVRLIEDIGCLVASVDDEMEYFSRIFCLLEYWAAGPNLAASAPCCQQRVHCCRAPSAGPARRLVRHTVFRGTPPGAGAGVRAGTDCAEAKSRSAKGRAGVWH